MLKKIPLISFNNHICLNQLMDYCHLFYITKLKKRKEKKNTIKVNPTIIGCKFLLFCESFWDEYELCVFPQVGHYNNWLLNQLPRWHEYYVVLYKLIIIRHHINLTITILWMSISCKHPKKDLTLIDATLTLV